MAKIKTLFGEEDDNIQETVVDNNVIAVKLYSDKIGKEVWISFVENFDPPDKLAVYHADELAELATYSPEHLQEVTRCMETFRGAKVLIGNKKEQAIIDGKKASDGERDSGPVEVDLWDQIRSRTSGKAVERDGKT